MTTSLLPWIFAFPLNLLLSVLQTCNILVYFLIQHLGVVFRSIFSGVALHLPIKLEGVDLFLHLFILIQICNEVVILLRQVIGVNERASQQNTKADDFHNSPYQMQVVCRRLTILKIRWATLDHAIKKHLSPIAAMMNLRNHGMGISKMIHNDTALSVVKKMLINPNASMTSSYRNPSIFSMGRSTIFSESLDPRHTSHLTSRPAVDVDSVVDSDPRGSKERGKVIASKSDALSLNAGLQLDRYVDVRIYDSCRVRRSQPNPTLSDVLSSTEIVDESICSIRRISPCTRWLQATIALRPKLGVWLGWIKKSPPLDGKSERSTRDGEIGVGASLMSKVYSVLFTFARPPWRLA
jgi:hypothetical protein